MKRWINTAILIIVILSVVGFSESILKLAYPMPYKTIVKEVTEENNVPILLFYSMMRSESKYDSKALSYAGAKGLMQLTDETFDFAKMYDDTLVDIYDPIMNIRASAWYLGYIKDNVEDKHEMVKAYNCGINNLDKEFMQTKIYSKRVFEFYDIYRRLYPKLAE